MTAPKEHSTIRTYFAQGMVFLRDHPQLWTTALLGVIIFGAFMYTAYRFAAIAQDAQRELVEVRVGRVLDVVALFAPPFMHDSEMLRAQLEGLKELNPTIDSIVVLRRDDEVWNSVVAIGTDAVGGIEELPFTYAMALSQRDQTLTTQFMRQDERRYESVRALRTEEADVLIITQERVAESDRVISSNINQSFYVLGAIILIIMFLFFRHARIVDYATLYQKQLEIDDMKDSFISMASHELKSPLTVIRGYIEFLKDDKSDVKARAEYLRRIDVSANELRQLIDDILDVSRIEMGRLRFAPEYIQPHDVLTETVEMFRDAASQKGLTIEVAGESDSTSVIKVDRGRLKQVMVNLVSNAVKYTMQGRITVEQHVQAELLELSVRDSGVGMTAEEQAKLFGKFYRVESDETRGVSGTGLGLWITQYLVLHMGGTISVESIKGEGSRFVVRFPIVREARQ